MNKIIHKKTGWYPVTTFGWVLTVFYTTLLVYVVVKVNADLYHTQEELFFVSILSIFIIILVLLWSRLRGEKPFLKR